jgi:hypothetical protein
MTQFEESHLIFEFGDTKAVDFVGIWDDKELYLIEVKNFSGHRISSKSA